MYLNSKVLARPNKKNAKTSCERLNFWPEGVKECCDDRVERVLLLTVQKLSKEYILKFKVRDQRNWLKELRKFMFQNKW